MPKSSWSEPILGHNWIAKKKTKHPSLGFCRKACPAFAKATLLVLVQATVWGQTAQGQSFIQRWLWLLNRSSQERCRHISCRHQHCEHIQQVQGSPMTNFPSQKKCTLKFHGLSKERNRSTKFMDGQFMPKYLALMKSRKGLGFKPPR